MHWGTFILTDEPVTEPPVRLKTAMKAAGLSDNEFVVYQHGETRKLDFTTADSVNIPKEAVNLK